MRDFNIGDRVICVLTHVCGIVEKFYYPTACAEQTMVITDDGRRYHAPTGEWIRCYEQNMEQAQCASSANAALLATREIMQMNINGEMVSVFKDEIEKELYKELYAGLYIGLDYGA